MLIVKPYGRSETVFDGDDGLRRKIRRNVDGLPADDLAELASFAESHPELVLAQWISAIDKIAAKPKPGGKPTAEQRRLRETLGRAALDLLTEEGFFDLSDKRCELERLWRSKIHPYGKEDDNEAHGREKGRWYTRFAGDRKPRDIDDRAAGEIVGKVREHLHDAEYRIDGGRPNKRQGRIAARGESVAVGVPALQERFPDGERPWSEEDRREYEAAGDVASLIRRKAEEKEKERGNRRVSMRDAAPVLYEQYGRLFRDRDGGKVLSIAEARETFPGLFALHCAVKGAYARVLKEHRKTPIARVLPADMDALFRLIGRKSDNRELAALVRLGKTIHYEATPPLGADTPADVVNNWPADVAVAHSRYRTSDGQSEIKRNEAFVRVWRNTVALAARTAKDWADPGGRIIPDILLKIEQATGNDFRADDYRRKLPILFGDRAGLFEGDDAFRRSVLRLALKGWAELRHSSFHFQGRGGFARGLRRGVEGASGPALSAARLLLKRDAEERDGRLVETLRGAHVEHYFDRGRLNALVDAVLAGAPPLSPLPRFRRVLNRAKDAWSCKPYVLRLPPPGNQAALEKPGRLCRYTVVKTLYERAFPPWLEERSHEALNAWIEHAAKRATEAARNINKDEFAVARSAGLVRLKTGEGIAKFVDRLTIETAIELRVQRGYDSDADKAREQAKYIDNLRCDVVGQAFEAWLNEARLAWVLEDLGDGPLPESKRGDLAAPPPVSSAPEKEPDDCRRRGAGPARRVSSAPEKGPDDWETVLYFLLHLAPVDAVNRLQHQLRKWSVLEGKPSAEAEAVGRLLDLYIAMHDAKFEGGEGMAAGAAALKGLFNDEKTFSRACPEQRGEDGGGHVPLRGLREVLRFGGLQSLMPVFEKHPIAVHDLDELAAFEKEEAGGSPIARRQKEREDLHEKRTGKKKAFSAEDRKAYRAALAEVARHRRLAAHVRLVNHARLHRLLMEVLGRLVDYAGLWERDLYFTTLALVRLRGKRPADVFDPEGLGYLREGRIVEALRQPKKPKNEDAQAIYGRLKRLFGDCFLDGKCGSASIRNGFMHFNMLRGGAENLDLTRLVNDARRLMAYDRKLKNAVSRSIVELMARENLELAWKMEERRLAGATVKARQAIHLGDKKLKEDLHGKEFVAMAAALFAGKPLPSEGDVLSARHAGGAEAGPKSAETGAESGGSARFRGDETDDCCFVAKRYGTIGGDHPQMKGDYTHAMARPRGTLGGDHPQMKGDYTRFGDVPERPEGGDHPQMKGDYTHEADRRGAEREEEITPK